MISLLQTSQKAYLESAGWAVGTEPTFEFWILQPHMSKLLAGLVYQGDCTRHYYYSEPSPESFQHGGFAVLRGGFSFVRGAWLYKINQNSTYL